ncbi:MAG: non-canonical purine NTP pyrophosphatase, RdgB/HAM1 family [Nitrospinae bacterium CG11_big_fil_rev_8_21_14_0_20_56_8]|nr:MAG: non-canonical purine NTP pyrophosphatase, RdgB/HAM1 family [Nitrospinae bacterium CG11_big_fil_rev_8_21_14_0_20_56_8]
MNSNLLFEKIKFVTGNSNKVREASQILGIRLTQVNVQGLHEIQTHDVEHLVREKVREAYDVLKSPVLVEDSGLIFTAWNGLPGALVKWFESTVGNEGMLQMLSSFNRREAKALCYAAIFDGTRLVVGKGEVYGSVADAPRGDRGFGWDVIFIPDGHDRTFAEMNAEEKNSISHRRMAFEDLKANLKS